MYPIRSGLADQDFPIKHQDEVAMAAMVAVEEVVVEEEEDSRE